MKHWSEKHFPQSKIGDTVKGCIPDMDRSRGDSRNDNYKLGTKEE